MDKALAERMRLAARCYLRAGLSVFPLRPGDKRPAARWAHYQQRRATALEADEWQPGNLGVVTGAVSGLVVADCDSMETAEQFRGEVADSPVRVRTRRGVHFWFKHPGVDVSNRAGVRDMFDVRGDGGFVVAPPSVIRGHQYHFTGPELRFDLGSLPVWNTEWAPPAVQIYTPPNVPQNDQQIQNVEAYVSKITAISGSGGDAATYRAVCKLAESGMSEAEALAYMVQWNETNAKPPWTVKEIAHKVKHAYR